MKHLSFNVLILCIVLPAALTGFSIQALEGYLTYRYTKDIENSYIGDMTPLLDGSAQLKDAVSRNIRSYLKDKALPPWAADIEVLVSTKTGTILYPPVFTGPETTILPRDSMSIAEENYALIDEGLIVTVDVNLGIGSLISIVILAFYILVAVAVLYRYYRAGIKMAEDEEKKKNQMILSLKAREGSLGDELIARKHKIENISNELERVRADLSFEMDKATQQEAQLFDEIVALDTKLKDITAQQARQLEEMAVLREKISEYEAELQKGGRQKKKEVDWVAKRFNAIYKNLLIHDRAVEGFIGLAEDMRIKAEEVIHRLNDAPDQVTIKRKVFTKKGRETVLEVVFSYNGRLYFRKSKQQEIEIVIIGTKNSQEKDLEYIDHVTRKSTADPS